jgi:DNA-binding NarL/FixJ family response regulator
VLSRVRAAGPRQPAMDVELVEPFTKRELDVLRLLGAGATNRQIAGGLNLSEGTVKNYISTILAKTGLRDRTQVALFALRRGLAG